MENLGDAVIEAFSSDNYNGTSFFLAGEEQFTFLKIISLLENAAGQKAIINQSSLEKVFDPLRDCIVGERLYTGCYQNCMRVLNGEWEEPAYTSAAEELLSGVELDSFRDVYAEGTAADANAPIACPFRKFLFD